MLWLWWMLRGSVGLCVCRRCRWSWRDRRRGLSRHHWKNARAMSTEAAHWISLVRNVRRKTFLCTIWPKALLRYKKLWILVNILQNTFSHLMCLCPQMLDRAEKLDVNGRRFSLKCAFRMLLTNFEMKAFRKFATTLVIAHLNKVYTLTWDSGDHKILINRSFCLISQD